MKTFLNGALEGMIEAAKRLWMVGAGMLVIVVWIFTVNQNVKDTQEIKRNVSVIPNMNRYMRDSLTTDSDSKFVLAQQLAAFRKMDNRVRRLEGRAAQEGLGRWEYFEQYGPIPDRYKDWYEKPAVWLDGQAAGLKKPRRDP